MILPFRDIPTVDIYFRAPLADLISERKTPLFRKPIKRIGPHTFVCGDRAVILRYLTIAERRQLERKKPSAVHYLIDDDLFTLATDTSLPEDYRRRLEQFAAKQLPWITACATEIVAPSQVILDRFPHHRRALLQPAYTAICKDFSHLTGDALHLIFPGTRSHLSDLEPLATDLRRLIDRRPCISLTTFLGNQAPKSLMEHPRISNRPAEKWQRFRTTIRTARFHLALVPNSDTTFNKARSINKIFDVAAFGAAGLYSARPPSALAVTHNADGLLLSDDPTDWLNAIDQLTVDRSHLINLARNGARLASRLGDPDRVRSFWLHRLIHS